MKKSAYLEHPQRLNDIMAAIQVMGTHIWDTRPIEHWVTVLGQQPLSIETNQWEDILERHPEFFGKEPRRINEVDGIQGFNYYLRWRRACERTIDVNNLKELTPEEIEALKTEGKYNDKKLARKPLTPEQVGTLLSAAIELQDRAIGYEARNRWWIPIVLSVGTALLGVLGVIAGAMLKTK